MRLKSVIILVAMGLIFTLAITSLIYIINPFASENRSSKYENKTDIQQIRKDNFVPGKEEALNNAKRYLEYAEYGSAFSANAIREELKAIGYTEDEIDYALKQIPEEEYINGIVKMYKAYDVKPTLEQAIDMWTDIGFTEKQIKKAFKNI